MNNKNNNNSIKYAIHNSQNIRHMNNILLSVCNGDDVAGGCAVGEVCTAAGVAGATCGM